VDPISRQRRYSREEVARRGDEIYEREVLPVAQNGEHIDVIENGDVLIEVLAIS
jgi:hypothetical protein